jgi:type I restriction enzyme, S subunit
MKQNPEIVPLGHLVELIMGQAPLSNDCNFDGRGTPFVKVGEFGEIRPKIREWTTNPLRMARRGDVLLCVVGATCGKINLGEDCAIGRSVAAIRPDLSKLDQFYLYYFMMTLVEQLRSGSVGAAQTVISKGMVETVGFPFVTLPEQQRIVGILDGAFDGIATAKANAGKNLQNTRALFESHLQSVFTQRGPGWVEKTLEQIGTTQTGSTPKTSDRANYGDFISFVKPADFNADGSLDYEKDGLTKKGLSEARKVAAKSVLMVCIGATIGKCGYSDRDVTTNQQINALTPFDGVSHEFVYYQMLTENFQRRVLLSSAQATLPIINKSKWSALMVVLPPKLQDQKRIAAKFESLCGETQHLESLYRRKLAMLEALKKSLLHQAFTGDL